MKRIKKVISLQEMVIKEYSLAMRKYNIEEFPEEPLIPISDDSILFTNSTIVPLKMVFIKKEYASSGYFVIQKCLRLQFLKQITDLQGLDPKHVSCFQMLGSLVPPENIEIAVASMMTFLEKIVGHVRGNIVITIPHGCAEDWRAIFSGCDVQFRVREPYSWKYGLQDIRGSGVAIAVQTSDGSIRNVGNFVAMYKNDILHAYEFGFGVEPIVGKVLLRSTAFAGSLQFSVTDLVGKSCSHQISNLIGVASAIFVAGVSRKKSRTRWFLFTQATRNLVETSFREGVTLGQLTLWVERFCNQYFGSEGDYRELVQYLTVRWRHISSSSDRFLNWLKSQQGLYRKGRRCAMQCSDVESVLEYAKETYSISRATAMSLLIQYEPWSL